MSKFDPKHYTPAKNLLGGRVVVVTGAGDGVGRSAALAFAKHGATVCLLGRTLSKLEAVRDEILAAEGPVPTIAHLDLAEAQVSDFRALAKKIDEEYGRLDGLLHNAAIVGPLTPIERQDVATWNEVLQVNLTVPFVLTKVLLPFLNKSDDASVLFTTSGLGRRGRARWGSYVVSKFGIEGLSQVLADEAGIEGKIRFNCVNPGTTRTSMRATAFPDEDPQSLTPPEKVLAPYLYLMGPDSKGVTGQSLDSQ